MLGHLTERVKGCGVMLKGTWPLLSLLTTWRVTQLFTNFVESMRQLLGDVLRWTLKLKANREIQPVQNFRFKTTTLRNLEETQIPTVHLNIHLCTATNKRLLIDLCRDDSSTLFSEDTRNLSLYSWIYFSPYKPIWISRDTLLRTNISLTKTPLKMSFLLPRLDMLVRWRVRFPLFVSSSCVIPPSDLSEWLDFLGCFCWKLGSMVLISGLFHPNKNSIYKQVKKNIY